MAEMMKAQVFYEAEKMQLEQIPIPHVSDIDVLVKVKNCGICGSDISYYYGYSPVGTATGKGPIVLGHEFTGEVIETMGACVSTTKLMRWSLERSLMVPASPTSGAYPFSRSKSLMTTRAVAGL